MNKQRFLLQPTRPGIRDRAIEAIWDAPDDEPVEVIVRPYKKRKSAEQLGYLWGGILPAICQFIEDSEGKHFTPDDVYEWMLDEYGERRVVEFEGVPKVIVTSASRMNVEQMSKFIERIIQHMAAEKGFAVPLSEYR